MPGRYSRPRPKPVLLRMEWGLIPGKWFCRSFDADGNVLDFWSRKGEPPKEIRFDFSEG